MNIEKKRYHDLDWLRVLGMVGIFLFHNARFFNDEDWHVKNNVLDFGMSVFVWILNRLFYHELDSFSFSQVFAACNFIVYYHHASV